MSAQKPAQTPHKRHKSLLSRTPYVVGRVREQLCTEQSANVMTYVDGLFMSRLVEIRNNGRTVSVSVVSSGDGWAWLFLGFVLGAIATVAAFWVLQ